LILVGLVGSKKIIAGGSRLWYFVCMARKAKWVDDRTMEGRLELRLDPELKADLEKYAEENHLRISEVARAALVEYLRRKRREDLA
jgi:predicted HicB family RNase H-like nuclease